MSTSAENSEATRIGEEWKQALARLTEGDARLLTLLRFMGEVIDPRYELKGIRLLVARALVDPEFRARALADNEDALAELRGHVELPENVRVRCVESTAEYLTILLPPLSGGLNEKSRTVRDLIYSRTSADLEIVAAAGVDDNDVLPGFFDLGTGDHDGFHFGDPSHDGH